MKKMIFMLCAFMFGGISMIKVTKKIFETTPVPELVMDIKYDTKVEPKDFKYSATVSSKYSKDVGMSEWVDL